MLQPAMAPKLKDFLQRWVITTVAVLVATHVVSGIHYDHWAALLAATLLLGLLNAFLRPVLLVLSLPFLILTLGLFSLVINALLLLLVGELVKSFHVAGFWPAFWASLVISVISVLLNSLTGTGSARVTVRRGRIKRPKDGDGPGPVIDV